MDEQRQQFGVASQAAISVCRLHSDRLSRAMGAIQAANRVRIAGFAAFPFGKELVDAQMIGEKRITGTAFANFLWIILAGLWLAIAHVLAGISCFLAFFLVFPIFFGIAHFKLASVCFAPLGKRAVSKIMAGEARRSRARAALNR